MIHTLINRYARVSVCIVMLLLGVVQAYGNNSVSHSLSDSVVTKRHIMFVGKGLYTKISMVVKNMFLR